jgi:hypothetical protein
MPFDVSLAAFRTFNVRMGPLSSLSDDDINRLCAERCQEGGGGDVDHGADGAATRAAAQGAKVLNDGGPIS